MLKAEIQKKLDALGVQYDAETNKADLEKLLDQKQKEDVDEKIEADKKEVPKDDKPKGRVEKIEKDLAPKHQYEMARTVKYDGKKYVVGEKVILTGDMADLFIRNNFVNS